MDVDQVLEHIGSFGRFQWITVILMNLSFLGTIIVPNLMMMYMTVEPPWKCSEQSTRCNLTGIYNSNDDLYKYRCDLNESDWVFLSEYTTLVTEFNLVCNRAVLWSVVISSMYPGTVIGGILFGAISDKYGRKKVLILNNISIFLLTFTSSFLPSFWAFTVFRFVIGVFVGGTMITTYVFALEFGGFRHRNTIAHLVGGLPWTYGRCVLSLFAFLFYSWRHLNIALSLLTIPGIVSLWYFPESPHWLLLEGRKEEARKCLSKIARVNGTKMPEVEIALAVEKPQDKGNGNTFDLFRTWSSAKFTLSAFTIWFSLSMQSYGTVFASVSLGGNMYLNVSIIGLILLPAPFICIWFTQKYGRRDVIVATLVLSSLCCGIYLGVLDGESTGYVIARVTLFVLISWFNELTWDAVYLMTAEYFPTMLRNVGTGWCSGLARVGAFLSSYVLMLGHVNKHMPLAILGSFTLLSAILAALQRDTKDDATPETVTEMDSKSKRKYHNNKVLKEPASRDSGVIRVSTV